MIRMNVKAAAAATGLLRPNVCTMAVLGLAIASIVFGINPLSIQFLFAAAAAFLICGSGNILNDYFDYKIDMINKPERPIPSGKISREGALGLFWIAGAAGLLFSIAVGAAFFAIAALNFAVSGMYAWKLKRTPVKGIFVAYLASSTFIAAPFIAGFPSGMMDSALMSLIVISFLGTLSRQLLMDIRDMEGDKKYGARTLPLAVGAGRTGILASILLMAAAGLLIAPYLQGTVSVYYLALAVPAAILSIYAITQNPVKGERTVKYVTFLVLFAFLVGTVL